MTCLIHTWNWLVHIWHDSFVHDTTHVCDMAHSCVIVNWVASWLVRDSCHKGLTHCHRACHIRISDVFLCVTWRIHTWYMTDSYVKGSFIRAKTYSYVTLTRSNRHDSFLRDMSHARLWRDMSTRILLYVPRLTNTWHWLVQIDMIHSYVTCLTHVCDVTCPLVFFSTCQDLLIRDIDSFK